MAEISAYFVSETWIRERTPIGQQTDIATIMPFLGQAQDVSVQPLLGTDLYLRLMAGVTAGNLSADETALVKLVRPALAYYTLAAAIPFVATQVRTGGVVKTTSGSTEPASASEVANLATAASNVADFYAQRVVKYLCDNASSFPLYPGDGDVEARGNSPYDVGFYDATSACSCGSTQCDCDR